jgi:hypothetical protein
MIVHIGSPITYEDRASSPRGEWRAQMWFLLFSLTFSTSYILLHLSPVGAAHKSEAFLDDDGGGSTPIPDIAPSFAVIWDRPRFPPFTKTCSPTLAPMRV